jgi:capsular polysaccharide transport system permease protein
VNSPRSSVQIMFDVVHALFMREVKTRFGSSKLGYFWAITQPISHIFLFGGLYYLTGRDSISSQPVVIFLITGIVPWAFFTNTMNQVGNAISANQSLFAYRQVKPIDTFITRGLMEISIFIVVICFLLAICWWWGYDVQPQNFLLVVSAYTSLFMTAFSCGMIIATASLYWDDVRKIIDMIMRPLYFASGIIFSVQVIPTKYWHYFQWNPMMQALDMGRVGFFHGYQSDFYQPLYLVFAPLVITVVAVMLYRINRERYVMS